jgi:DUF971 family protein
MSVSENPVSISANRETRELTITWDDQHISRYPFGLVRMACPCASCRGGHENMRADPDPIVFTYKDFPDQPETRMKGLEGVGSYAVMFEWEDGHHTGIYNWHYLRALCPCDICRGEKQK